MIAAVVPAAGHSQRMGRPKLILTLGPLTVIARVVTALLEGGVSTVVVVAPPADAPGAELLRAEAEAAGAVVVVPPTRPADMRGSFEAALAYLEARDPRPATLLLTPADSPGINPSLVARVIARARERPGSIVVPTAGERRGHPVAFPWASALSVRGLPEGVGVNALVGLRAGDVDPVPVDDPDQIADLDTPEDYQRWVGRGVG